jgi:hypothetical protein
MGGLLFSPEAMIDEAQISSTPDGPARANIRHDGEPPSVEQLAEAEGLSDPEKRLRELEWYVKVNKEAEKLRLSRERSKLIKEKRRYLNEVENADKEIARVEADLRRIDPAWKPGG